MALLTFNFPSKYLSLNTEINVIMPELPKGSEPEEFYSSGKKYKVLWLLHGGMGDHTDWVRKSNIELYACDNDLVVVMPSAYNSSYANWDTYARGLRMYDYFFKELMPMVYHWLPVSDQREDNFIAGMSMGGQGTMKFVLNHPEKFAAAASLSVGVREYPQFYYDAVENGNEQLYVNLVHNNGGIEAFMDSKENMRRTMERIVQEGRLDEIPPIYSTIGLNDAHYKEYEDFKNFCERIAFSKIEFHSVAGYMHEWRFWDIVIQDALEFFGFDTSLNIRYRSGFIGEH